MPWSDVEKRRAAIRRHYYANREMYIEKSKKRKIVFREYIKKIKESTPCSDCSIQYPYYVMDFDHIGNKIMTVSKLLNLGNLDALMREVTQCELVCSNCHRARTHTRLAEK
jgi:hypothetical protein